MTARFQTLVQVYERSVRDFADRDLFGVKEGGAYRWLSYAEIGERVDVCRTALAEAGVGRGDTVAIISDNRVEWAVCAYATYGLGARFCPMYESQDLEGRTYILEDSEASFLFAADRGVRDEVEELQDRGELERVRRIVHFDGGGTDDFGSFLDVDAAEPVPLIEPEPDDICGLLYTSGTTGDPKGVLLTHRNITSNINAIHAMDIIDPGDTSLAFLPWAHSFGQTAELHSLFSTGASMGLVEDVSTIVENLGEIQPTLLFSVPRVFSRIHEAVHRKLDEGSGLQRILFSRAISNAGKVRDARASGRSPSVLAGLLHRLFDRLLFSRIRDRFGGRLRYAISGGAKLREEVARFLDLLEIMVLEGYGLTETSPLVSVNLPGQHRIGSVGRPVPGVEVEIRDVAEGDHGEGEGEVCVRGPNVMKGYFKKPEKTREVLDPDGTFHTGDLGFVDDDGFLYIVGRVKERYKLETGKYVVPGPVEDAIESSELVEAAMLFGANRPFSVVLVNVAREPLEAWAEARGIPTDDTEKFLDHNAVRALYMETIEKTTTDVKKFERPKDVVLVDDEWSAENGILTPKLSLRRRVVEEKYADTLKALYERGRA